MFAKLKIWLIAGGSLLVTILFALLRIKQSELDVAEEKLKVHVANKKLSEKADEAEDVVLEDFWEKEKAVEKEHDSKIKKANKVIDSRPLSPESIRLLKRGDNSEGTDSSSS